MSLFSKLLLALVAVGVTPAVIAGSLAFVSNEKELSALVTRMQSDISKESAREISHYIENLARSMELSTRYLPFSELSPEQLETVLRLPLQQLPALETVAVLDSAGKPLCHPVSKGDDGLVAFSSHIPASTAGVASLSDPYRTRDGTLHVGIVVPIEGKGVIVAADVSLAELDERIAALSGMAFLTIGSQAFAHSRGSRSLTEDEAALVGEAAGKPLARVITSGDERWLAAFTPLSTPGWGLTVAERLALVERPAARAQAFSLFWVAFACLVALAVAVVLARNLTRPIAALSHAAAAVSRGEYDTPMPPAGADEIGVFTRAFTDMVGAVRSFNQQLERRVAERTAELHRAEEQLLRARRLAATGSLAAGLSHELNNPLTSVLGLVALARRQAPDSVAPLLDRATEQAKRIAKIVSDVRQFAENEQQNAGRKLALARPVRAAVAAVDKTRVSVDARIDDTFEVFGDAANLQRLVEALLQNAIDASANGGHVEVALEAVGAEAVKIRVMDEGHGIDAAHLERVFDPFFSTKTHGHQVGLGLTVAHRIVEQHHGSIHIESRRGRGTTVSVILPLAFSGSHLV